MPEEQLSTEQIEVITFKTWLENKCIKIDAALQELFSNTGKSSFLYPSIVKILKTDKKERKNLSETANDIEEALDRFQDISALINEHTVFVPDIENFSAFMGWTSKKFKQMCESSDGDIVDAMQNVDDYIFDCQYSAGQLGFTKGNLTKTRSQLAGSHGQGVATVKESAEIDKNNRHQKTQEEMMKELEALGFKTNKQIDFSQNRKKK